MTSSFFSHLPHTLDYDPRAPIFTAKIMDKVIGFYSIDLFFVRALLGYIVVEVLCAAVTTLLVYQFCVVHKQEKTEENCEKEKKKKNQGVSPTMASIMVGYGLVIPIWAIAPYYVFELCDFQNVYVRFILSLVPILIMFRTAAVVHGFVPAHTTKSVTAFLFYYALPLPSIYDEKKQQYVKSTIARKMHLVKSLLMLNLISGVWISLYASNYFPSLFPTIGSQPVYDNWYPPSAQFFTDWFLNPRQVYLNFMTVSLYSTYMTMFAAGLQLLQEVVCGIQTIEVMDNPIRQAKTPAEFWGKRWNVLIHDALKNGVYKPCRALVPGSKGNLLGVYMTFFMSAVFHEYMLVLMFPLHGKYQPLRGFCFLFFHVHAFWVALDMTLTRKSTFLQEHREIVKFVWAYLFLTIIHWFTAPYADSNVFAHGAPMLFTIKEVVLPAPVV